MYRLSALFPLNRTVVPTEQGLTRRGEKNTWLPQVPDVFSGAWGQSRRDELFLLDVQATSTIPT